MSYFGLLGRGRVVAIAARWVGFLVFIFILASIVGAVSEGFTIGSNEMVIMQGTGSWNEITQELDFGLFQLPGPNSSFWESLKQMIILDYPCFHDQYEFVRWIVLGPIIATIVTALILTFISIFSRVIT